MSAERSHHPEKHLMAIYPHRLPVSFSKGSGVWLWDVQGNQYLDALAGIAVCGLGHSHPAITQTICEQASRLTHTSNAYHIPEQATLAERLARVSGMDQVFFSNSGAEAIEAALKMSRLYARKKGIAKPIVIAMKNAFHGRTMGALSASGSARLQVGFEPLLEQFIHVPFNDVAALTTIAEQHKQEIVAIMLEPIQGDGGICMATSAFLNAVRKLCDEHDWLMILDEIQTGLCRTGPWFAYQNHDLLPDVVTVAKTLGNGFPIGAYLSRGKANDLFDIGQHGSTFAGSALACAVATTVLETLEKEGVSEHVKAIGSYLMQQLKTGLSKHPHVVSIHGQGLMLGITLDKACRELTHLGLKHRLLFNVVADQTIRLLPPLILQKSEADEICNRLIRIINEFYAGS